jgi:Raf kinase inhibitor-like YbhB/YbcL family protein
MERFDETFARDSKEAHRYLYEDFTMKVTSTAIVNGVIQDKYGMRGPSNEYDIPNCSVPVRIEDAPVGTVSYAIVMEDKDDFPWNGGFSWIHWTAANITKTELAENESLHADFVQGVTSWISDVGGNVPREACSMYGGPQPMGGNHTYEFHVYALDSLLNLENGFDYNVLYHKMDGHILSEYTMKGTYSSGK